jgi:hypothetical protein
LRKDLRALRRPILVVFDSYEGCNKPIADWISQQFLPEVETALGLAVIVAGQDVPDCTMSPWRDLVAQFALGPINNAEDWGTWIERHFPQLRQKGADLRTVLMFAQGNPMVVSRACEVIAKN